VNEEFCQALFSALLSEYHPTMGKNRKLNEIQGVGKAIFAPVKHADYLTITRALTSTTRNSH